MSPPLFSLLAFTDKTVTENKSSSGLNLMRILSPLAIPVSRAVHPDTENDFLVYVLVVQFSLDLFDSQPDRCIIGSTWRILVEMQTTWMFTSIQQVKQSVIF
jgi:hypothetical protein